MQPYLDLMTRVMEEGTLKADRTGTGTKSVFGHQMRFDLSEGFPCITTKKLHLKSIIHELLWFLNGDTNIKYLNENGVRIWDQWADENGDLGHVYGYQWRSWPAPDGKHIDQITQVVDALKNNPELHYFALEKQIIIVSVTNLIAAMKTISFIWKQENQTKNVIEIARQSGALYDKFCNFMKDLEDVGKHISQTNAKYDDAVKKLSTGKDNLIRKTERIKELGAKTKKSLPKELVNKSENNLLEEILNEK